MRSPTARRRAVAVLLGLAALALPASVLAHPLGNFTINHYAALRVAPDQVALDVVVDLAEIPAFQARSRIDTNGDGAVDETETDAARADLCSTLATNLDLRHDGSPVDLRLVAAGLSFPAGAGGVPTMRSVCEYEANARKGLADGRPITFADTANLERIGWREIVVLGDGVVIDGLAGGPPPTSVDVSSRLTIYPTDLLAQPLNVAAVAFIARPGGPALAPFMATDARPLPGIGTTTSAGPSASAGTPGPGVSGAAAVVPGGVGEIPDLFRADLTPLVAIASILLAVALGAGHALTPGHGKTLMAAYLVGTRGTIRHAAGLGLAVTVSHTLGILALALLVTGAESVLPADAVARTIPIVAALAFVAIGGAMLVTEVRRRWRVQRLVDHEHQHPHPHPHQPDDAHLHPDPHDDAHANVGAVADGPIDDSDGPGQHRHGGIRHSHLPADDRRLSWRSLFALGLAGGIIPSTNALIILLGSIVAGRAAFGIVLVVAFGLGMALVLAGVGALTVVARERLERFPMESTFGRITRQAPLFASVAVLGVGLWLTGQAISGATTL